MQDRFRFRAWSDKYNRYLNGHDIYNETLATDNSIYTLLDFYSDSNEYVFEQCTGLKDKNGKLIYEGDILNVKYQAASDLPQINLFEENCIEYDDGKAEYSISTTIGKRKEKISLSSLIGDESEISVIGNIHENPELLEGTND